MNSRRSGAGVGVVDNTLYAIGGHDGPLVRKSCEKYCVETDTWSPVAGTLFNCRRFQRNPANSFGTFEMIIDS